MYGSWVRIPAGSLKASEKSGAFLSEDNFLALTMPFMYILHSAKLKKYYVGACTNLDSRLYEHNIGHSKFTSLGLPWELVYAEEFDDIKLAKKRELDIKKRKSNKFILLVTLPIIT